MITLNEKSFKIRETSGMYKEGDKAHEVHSIHPEIDRIQAISQVEDTKKNKDMKKGNVNHYVVNVLGVTETKRVGAWKTFGDDYKVDRQVKIGRIQLEKFSF